MYLFLKKYVLALVLIQIMHSAHAQTIDQGTWTAGGSIGFSSSKQEGAGKARTLIEFLPDVGYFIIDDLGVGLNAVYSRTSQNTNSFTQLAIGPWARYYIFQNVFTQAAFNLGPSIIKGDFGTAKTSESEAQIALGYSAWVAGAVALEPIIYFNRNTAKDENNASIHTNSFGLRLGLKIFFGKE